MVESVRFVSAQTLEEVLRYDELIPTMENALGQFSNPESGVIQPVRTVLKIPAADGMFCTMPAYIRTDEVLSAKLVTFFPRNTVRPTHHAIVVLFHPQTGIPVALLDGNVITAKRTGAVSAAASKHLVSGTPRKLGILGAGVLARSHFFALSHLYQFEEVNIWNPRPAKAQALAAELGAHVVVVETAEEAVRGADIIVTATNSSTPVLQGDWVKPGAHINGQNDSAHIAYTWTHDATITAEIGEVFLGKVQAKKAETTIFKSLGIAIEDAATAGLAMKLLDARDARDAAK